MKTQFTTHLQERLARAEDVEVELRVASHVDVLNLRCPVHYDGVSVVSSFTCKSAFPLELGRFGARYLAKATINQWNRLSTPKRISGRFYDTRDISPNNVAHLFIDILPVCLKLKRELGDDTRFVFRRMKDRYRQIVEMFGIDIITSHQKLRGQQIEVFLSRNLCQFFPIHTASECPKFGLFSDVYDDVINQLEPLAGFESIFLSRRDHRGLLNKDDVERLLTSHGYRTVYMEDYDIRTQMRIAKSARQVAAVHGAAMGYLTLSHQLDSVIELLPADVYHNFFPIALGRRVRSYQQLVPSFCLDVHYAGWPAILAAKNKPFQVDLHQLDGAIRSRDGITDTTDRERREADCVWGPGQGQSGGVADAPLVAGTSVPS